MDQNQENKMTTREVYFKALYYSENPICLIRYIYKNEKGVVHTNGLMTLTIKMDEKIIQSNIERMKMIENRKGFMFWAISPEGEKFLEDNRQTLGEEIYKNLY